MSFIKLLKARKYLIDVSKGKIPSMYGENEGEQDFVDVSCNSWSYDFRVDSELTLKSCRLFLTPELCVDTETATITDGRFTLHVPEPVVTGLMETLGEHCKDDIDNFY